MQALISAVGAAIGIVCMPGAMTLPTQPQTWGYLAAVALLGYAVQAGGGGGAEAAGGGCARAAGSSGQALWCLSARPWHGKHQCLWQQQ